MARSNDLLRKHPAFLAAARGAIGIYLSLDTTPYSPPSANGHSGEGSGDGSDGISEEERRKAEKKAKKAEAKAKAAAAASSGQGAGANGKNQTEEDLLAKEKEDDDPTGVKAWSTKTPLDDVKPWLVQLERLGENVPEAQELIAKVALRQSESQCCSFETCARVLTEHQQTDQYLRASKAIFALKKAAPSSPALHELVVSLALAARARSGSADVQEAVLPSVKSALEELLPGDASLESYNSSFLQQHPGDASAILAAAKAQWAISGQSDKQGVHDLLLQLCKEENAASTPLLMETREFLLSSVGQEAADALQQEARKRWPRADAFRSKEERETQKREIEERRKKEREAGNENKP